MFPDVYSNILNPVSISNTPPTSTDPHETTTALVLPPEWCGLVSEPLIMAGLTQFWPGLAKAVASSQKRSL